MCLTPVRMAIIKINTETNAGEDAEAGHVEEALGTADEPVD